MECLISPMISSTIPAHSHIIPITVFSIKNHNGDARIHIIARIKFPVLLIIIPPVFKKQPPLRPVISFCPFDYITPIPCLPQKYGAKQPLCHTLFIVLTTFQSSVSALSNHSASHTNCCALCRVLSCVSTAPSLPPGNPALSSYIPIR